MVKKNVWSYRTNSENSGGTLDRTQVGIRDGNAASGWEDDYARKLTDDGFRRGGAASKASRASCCARQ